MDNKYYDKFVAWKNDMLSKNKDDRIIKSRKQANTGTIISYPVTEEEMNSFKQCYTEDKSELYWKARKDLPEYWFISSRGTLITCYYNDVYLVPPANSGRNKNKREQYEKSANRKIGEQRLFFDPATLVALAFGGQSTSAAKKLLNEMGIKAINDGLVELHHIYGYEHGDNTKKGLANKRENNVSMKRTLLLTHEEHVLLNTFPEKDASRDKNIDKMLKAMDIYKDSDQPVEIVSFGNKTGNIINNPSFQHHDGCLWIGNWKVDSIEDVIFVANVNVDFFLADKDGNEIIRGKDVPEAAYDMMMDILKDNARAFYSHHSMSYMFDVGEIDGRGSVFGGVKATV